MNEKVKSISIVFENCEVLDIPLDRIGMFIMDDITTSLYKHSNGEIVESSVINTLFIEIFNRTKDKALNRIVDSKDIVSIYLNYENGFEDKYYVNFNDENEYVNHYQHALVRENGDILVFVSEERVMSEFIEVAGDGNIRYELNRVKERPIEGFIVQEKYIDPRTIEYKAKKYAIEKIEKLYGNLALEIDECKGQIEDAEVHSKELNIYKQILEFIDKDYEIDDSKLIKEAYDRAGKEKSKDGVE